MGTRAFLYRLAWLSSLFGAGCATVVAPTGGPEDKLSPRVAGISPAPNSVNQPQRLEATLQFDEWIASSIPRAAVAISPPLDKKIRLEVDGDVLRISSDAPLDSATTYTLTITSGLKDLRGNAIAEPFTLVFSTGAKLDSLRAKGRVLLPDSLRRSRTFPAVGLYPLGQERLGRHYLSRYRDTLAAPAADTMPRLHKEPPLYITHTDSTGAFQFQGLRPGLYQVMAFADLDGNQRLEPSGEMAGLGESLLRLDSTSAPLWLTLGDQDTTALRLEGVSQRGRGLLEVAFSRNPAMDSAFLAEGNCTVIRKGVPGSPLPIRGHYQEALSRNLVLQVDSLQKDTIYRVSCLHAEDSLGRKLDARMNYGDLEAEAFSDTVSARLSSVMPARGAQSIWSDTPIELSYNQPVSMDTLAPRMKLLVNADTLPAQVSQADAVRLEVRGPGPWGFDAQVKLLLLTPDTTFGKPDSAGHVDTTVTYASEQLASFQTVAKLKLASLTGQVPGGNARTVIRLRSQDRPDEIRTALCDAQGRFRLEGLREGLYTVDYFHDLDGDRRPSPGRIFPPTPGEPWRASELTLILPHGDDNVLEKLLPDLPRLPSSLETP